MTSVIDSAPIDVSPINADTDRDAASAANAVTVLRRDGTGMPFDPTRITTAVAKAFLAVRGEGSGQSAAQRAEIAGVTDTVVTVLARRQAVTMRPAAVEEIQDQVELALMRAGQADIARAYILYREKRRQERDEASGQAANEAIANGAPAFSAVSADGARAPIDRGRLRELVFGACAGLVDTDADSLYAAIVAGLYDGMPVAELGQLPILTARERVEKEPEYSTVAARLLADTLRSEALGFIAATPDRATAAEMAARYPNYFVGYVARGVELGQLDPRLAEFDLGRLGAAIDPSRDDQFTYLGLQTLYDRYFLHHDGTRYELPQAFFMRVAMGLALGEDDREARAIEFYKLLSSFDFMCSTPTLFNAGTVRPQLSSCFLTTVPDDLDGIFSSIRGNALLAKYSGGIGNDWTPVRGIGSHIRGTNGTSSGVVPFLKIANDTAVAVNQGGKRKGAVCAYLEPWHIDIEEFVGLRRNTGDDRRRTHDMNIAVWVPDEMIRRVEAGGHWTLFSPDEVPDLHDLYGTAFADRYAEYEAAADRGEIRVWRRVPAVDLWRRMLTMLFETGHPWITFKDACNVRSPQQHTGVVHSSNLCTEITLNTTASTPGSDDGEVAVCNLGSVNLAAHTAADGIDIDRLRKTVTTAVRMLDNVIDINMYTVPPARRSNLRHRPVGMGIMGFTDALYRQGFGYASEEAVEFADESTELISYFAIEASSRLAAERGRYESYDGSLWSRGILPIDSIGLLAEVRGGDLGQDRTARLDWDALRASISRDGMRNSNLLAIAPTATIANICGVTQSIEPTYRNLFVKSNMSGEFTVVNDHLVAELKERGLWDEAMIADLKYFDGSLAVIDRIPADIRARFATAFEIDGSWLIKAASRRQKWLDQAQSLNIYAAGPDGKKIDALYRLAWRMGCKTTYYLRSASATHVEKSTLRGTDGRLNAVPASPAAAPSEAARSVAARSVAVPSGAADDAAPQACAIEDPDCEACQ